MSTTILQAKDRLTVKTGSRERSLFVMTIKEPIEITVTGSRREIVTTITAYEET